ncbi:MAG: cytochrome c [Nitrospira sp.]|nr:MAG: cytochrome c [Nitrospira sp.]
MGPDLQGVTARRDRTWLSRFLQAPDVMRAKQDPLAVALSARFPGVTMPNLGLSATDVGDLLAYVETQTAWPVAPALPFVKSEK